ncbi:ribonuclease P protein subunit p40 isoform X2 [Spea bombifrons]|uniref:ribonuclease P protein subunit p40 isoform X2 n=1 Tax=Spea bombifrons TaxID=233779 RepID=UPI00234A8CA4|nr:ribonuclease P protein subunit p40 isoform X2 [Spea bombifrons]
MLQSLQSCPRHLLVCEKSNFLQEKSRHSAHVETHYFNCSASVLLPECGSLPEQIKNTIESFGNYYVVKNLPLYEFITQDFINKFIKKGSFYALSYQTRIDQDNTAALLPTGKLLISVAKDTYEELGLQGKPSLYSGKHAMRYIVSVDLTDRSLTTEGKKFQRVHWCLAEKKPLAFDFLLASDNEETPSILSYFSKYDIKECPYKVSSTISRNLHCPVIKSGQLQGSPGESCGSEELFEWLGAVSNNIDCEYFAEPKLAPWVSLMVHGFADSPVSWKENEHGFCKGGENLYSFVVFNNQDYWIHMAVGTFDGCPP